MQVSKFCISVIGSSSYLSFQQATVAFVSAGVILATLSRPSPPKSSDVPIDVGRYTIGVGMLTFSLFLTGTLGVLQEWTYSQYGPHWKEGVFYTVNCINVISVLPTMLIYASFQHFLSLPIFLFFIPDLKRGFSGLANRRSPPPFHDSAVGGFAPYVPYVVLVANMVTQLACVSGVNQLSAVCVSPFPLSGRQVDAAFRQRVSSVSTNLVLTTRKAISLCFSVWWFGNGWNAQLGIGAGMVFLGSLLYTVVTAGEGPGSRSRMGSTSADRETKSKAE